eukprot:m.49004 g.49004  ORF g.49004 m.49004 type:complete len:197 (+) comp12782_c0_seq2:256-846(+)
MDWSDLNLPIMTQMDPSQLTLTLELNNPDASADLMRVMQDLRGTGLTPTPLFSPAIGKLLATPQQPTVSEASRASRTAQQQAAAAATAAAAAALNAATSAATSGQSPASKLAASKAARSKRRGADDSKSQSRRDKNREAAAKCRQRRRELIESLEHECSLQQTENSQLSKEIEQKRREIQLIRSVLERHHCVLKKM